MAFGSAPARAQGQGKATATPPLDIVLKPPRFGVCVFNNPSNPTSGVACSDDQRPVMFSARTELPSDTIWISDAANSVQAQNFRASNYLRSTPKQIGDDLGVDVRDPVEGLGVVAECLSRVRDLAAHAYPWMDLSVDWSDKTLGASIAKVTRIPSGVDLAEPVPAALKQAYQAFSSVPDTVRPDFVLTGGGRLVTLRVNRLRYAHYLTHQMFPCGGWRALSRATVLQNSTDYFLDPSRPSLVEGTIEFLDRNALTHPALVAFGSSGSHKPTLRNWISQPELAWLVQHANVHITSALICERADALATQLQLPRVLTADPVYALSIAAGVLAESHWTGISAETFSRRAMPGATAQLVSEVTPHAVWLRAYDRAYTFQMALVAQSMGFVVTGYGYGAVTFWAQKESFPQLLDLAQSIGACHPDLAAMQERDALSLTG